MEKYYIVVAVNHGKRKSTLCEIYDYTNKNGERVVGVDTKKYISSDEILEVGTIKKVSYIVD